MDSIVYKDEEVKYLQARIADLEERLVSSSEGHMRDKAVLRAEIDRLYTQVQAAEDSIERSKDYESELRAEVERLRLENGLVMAESATQQRRITELEGAIRAALDGDTNQDARDVLRAALSQEKK